MDVNVDNKKLMEVCFLLQKRNILNTQRSKLRTHIAHCQKLKRRVSFGETISRGILKGKTLEEVKLYLLSKECDFRDILLQRSALVRSSHKKLKSLLADLDAQIYWNANNIAIGLRYRTTNDVFSIDARDIERLANDFIFYDVLFAS